MPEKSPFPDIVAIYFPLNAGGMGVNSAMSVRAKEDHARFVEHPHEVEVWIQPRGATKVTHHYKVHKSQIRYIEYAD